jgi:hypothetical protein
VNKGFLKLVSLCLVGVLLSVPGYAQNYRVKAERYERGVYSPETNPPSVRYAIIDLGPDVEPIRLSNSGHVLCQPTKPGKLQSRWYQGQFQELTGGDDSLLIGTLDMNNAGTVVGAILEYKTGSVRGIPPCPDSESAWYRSPSYGIRRAAAWYAGSGGASLLGQPEYGFNIYDCTVPQGPPYTGTATFGSAWTIDDSGQIYGEAQVAYAEHQSYDGFFLPTVPGAAYSGFGFGGAGILGDLSLVYDPTHNIYTTQGKSYYVRKVRNSVTMGYDGAGQNFVNSLPVDFVPTTMNSQGVVLGAVVVDPNSFFGYTKFIIYDPATRLQTDLPMRASRFFGPGQFHPPVALNHRTITVTNSAGQTTSKVSPQIVGPGGAVIWEEDPKTGQYFYQSLNLLIPENSGWTLTTAKAINDNGAIICKGTFQAKDAAGNPVGNPQTRACLLQPTPPVEFEFKLEHQGPPEARNYVQANTTLQNGTKPDLRSDITIATQASSTIGPVTSSRGAVDQLNPATVVTGADGKFKTTLSTREKSPGLRLSVKEVKSAEHQMLPALYKNTFHITGYFTPSESDPRFTGSLVTSTTLFTGSGSTRRRYDITSSRAAKEDFLKSIAVEGEGYFSDGTHAVVNNQTQPGTSNPIVTTTTVTSNNLPPKGTRNRNLVANSSCAIVRNPNTGDGIVVPDAATLQIVGQQGRWLAIDRVSSTETGGTYHIDLYKGFDRVAASMISADTEVILLGY